MRTLLLGLLMLAGCQPAQAPQSDLGVSEPRQFLKVSTGEACGGMSGTQCGIEGDFCKTTVADMCMAADAMGVCTPTPNVCTQDYAPICGCDDQTYPNECAANAKGVSISYEGECGG